MLSMREQEKEQEEGEEGAEDGKEFGKEQWRGTVTWRIRSMTRR